MRLRARLFPWLIGLLLSVPVPAQPLQVDLGEDGPAELLRLRDLHHDKLSLPGVGADVPGLEVEKAFLVRHCIGPASHGADRIAPDSTWHLLSAERDSVRRGHGLHWIRFTVNPAAELCGLPMVMAVESKANFEIYLNGRFLMRSSGTDAFDALSSSKPRDNFVSFSFACDGLPETVAVRIAAKQDASFADTGFRMSLHEGDLFYGQQRLTTHFGIFIGINLVVLLFSLVMWWSDRRERTWLFLGLISLFEVVGIYTELATGMQVFGMGAQSLHLWRMIGLFLVPWQFFFLLRVLGLLRGKEPVWRVRRALLAAIVSSLVMGAVGGMLGKELHYEPDGQAESVVLLVVGGLAGLATAVFMGWLITRIIWLGFGLMRTKGYARWVGAGAIVSFVLAVMIRLVGAVVGGELTAWMDLAGMYANHAAVPLFTGVYLSIQSARHMQLVKRQRDELDAEVKERTAELRSEKERSEELLLNILPEEVAEELKAKGEAEAQLIEHVTVMFTDFKGFTALSERLGPRELVADINECFSAFDRIMGQHGVEKIKTIGDAYMAAGGLPMPNTTHARDTVLAALEVQAFIAGLKVRKQAAGMPFFEVRIGVHTGPVVAGIVGVKKFQYDIWGDTVNTASRMESSGEVGRVNLSAATYALVKDDPAFRFTPRGLVEAKGKGEMEMYFVERAAPGA